ncbi:MAG: Crp/Fnr family transcriptional regulator [Pseudomonadota bacterium]
MDHFFDLLDERRKAAAMEAGRRCDFKNRMLLIRQGDPPDGIFVILSGTVESVFYSEGERELRLARWRSRDFVGAPHLFGDAPQRWSARAVGSVTALHLDQDCLRGLIRSEPNFAETLITCLGYKGERYSDLAQNLAFHSVPERLARALLRAALNNHGVDTETGYLQSLNRLELSQEIGSTRQAVGAALKSYEKSGIIERQIGEAYSLDLKSLRVIAGLERAKAKPRMRACR